MNNMRRKNVMEALELIEKAIQQFAGKLAIRRTRGTNAGERRRYRRILKLLRRNR